MLKVRTVCILYHQIFYYKRCLLLISSFDILIICTYQIAEYFTLKLYLVTIDVVVSLIDLNHLFSLLLQSTKYDSKFTTFLTE